MKLPRFSPRTAWDRTENPLTTLLAAAKRESKDLVDLTESNPTRAGIVDTKPLIALLGHERGTSYAPMPLGHPRARAAVAKYFRERGLPARDEHIALSASTSEAYAWLFKLLCDRGDRVLFPKPSYPLFDFLARLEDVELMSYPLVREDDWRIDFSELESAILESGDRARAVVVVHPNNPTGSLTRRDEAEALTKLAAQHGLAIIVDEVFAEYTRPGLPEDRLPSFSGNGGALTFVLGGLSKSLAMPQCKLAWTSVYGPEEIVQESMARLELIADTYLSVATPIQLALPEMLEARASVQDAVRARTSRNLETLDRALAEAGPESAARRLPVDGGWYAILEVPRTRDEDAWIALLLREHGVIVHPGYFFDMERDGFLVVSLLPAPDLFAAAITKVVQAVAFG